MRAKRSVIDYSLARRALLSDLFSGRASTLDVCDAHPYLLRAAKYHGSPRESICPVCRKEPLIDVHYAFSDELRESSGCARGIADLTRLARDYAEVSVYVVEVCQGCGWNHLTTSFVVGHGAVTASRRSRRRAAEE
jgi:hypothetical protein